LRKNTYFPLFIPNLLPEGMEILQGYILRFAESKEIWEARVDFGFKDDAEPLISTSARPIFSKPYPIWPVVTYPEKDPEEIILDDEFIVKMPEKVGFTPEYGVMIYSDRGYTLQWIGNEILYTLFMEYEKLRNDVESVGNSLVEI
ncbi:MAG: hypothetical protein Q8M94_03025, partial [Ignavibacteria bacterium]|nr:hypothetical protein [Ignavibacteria bacterium]